MLFVFCTEKGSQVSYFEHGFQGWWVVYRKVFNDSWKTRPVSEYNSQLWNGIEANREIARKQKRRLHYVSNIYVVSELKGMIMKVRCFLTDMVRRFLKC